VPKAIQIATAMHQTIAAYGRAIRILPPLENARNQRVNNIGITFVRTALIEVDSRAAAGTQPALIMNCTNRT
jgi:hypothetical protein